MNTNVELTALSIAQLTELYNTLAEKPVKKFASKPVAVDRLQAVLDASKHIVFETDGEYDVRPAAEPEAPEGENTETQTQTEGGAEGGTDQPEPIVLTDLEFGLMDLIAHAEHNQTNGATPTETREVHTWLWADEWAKELGITEQAAGGVLSSLAQKGAIQMDTTGKKADRGVWFLDAGFTAWRADYDAKRKYERPAKKAKKAKPAPTGKRGPAPEYADHLKITAVIANPKREGSAAHARFALYKEGMTVGEFLKAGGTRADLAWDSKREHIKIG